ncbi:MAG: transmembrane 220 family protein [Pseudomonadota bacterium]
MLVILLLSAAVQYNDPDPWLWIVIYTVGAGFTLAYLLGYTHRLALLLAGSIGLVGTIVIILPLQQVETANVISSVQMQGEGVEEVREAGGLALQSVWLLYLAWRTRL